ncbi:MAG TPA: hypothetical protein DEQ83_06400, partial [Rhodobiaceae bacterium]|nr:hypothetical protein [Rhodobiaceae bacterium]
MAWKAANPDLSSLFTKFTGNRSRVAVSEKYYHLHLISDSTGETLNVVAKAVCAQFVGARAIEHVYALVRGK